MYFSQLYGSQLDIELGSQDRSQLFTTARRQKAINDAMHNFERMASCTPVLGTIAITDGVAEYDLLGNFSNFVSLQERREPSIRRVSGSGSVTWIQGEDFPRKTPTFLDRDEPGWEADPKGVPNGWYLRDDAGTSYVGLTPPPGPAASGETWTLYVPYLASSDDMVSDGDQPFTINGIVFAILAPYHQALVHYAAGLLEPLRKNYSGAQRQMGLYAGYVAQYETKKRKDGPNQITMRRTYLRDAQRPSRPVDPHRFP
jgi:hypothetical protein